jgi:hypothetical protein
MLICMRTTLELDDTLMRKAKELAAAEHKPLRAIVEQALREKFLRYHQPEELKPELLVVSEKTGGTVSGIDLDSSSALYDRMEEADGPL